MSKRYSVFAKAYKTGIIIGFRTIDDVRPEALRKDVEELLAMDGLGPDGKPLPKEPEKPVEEVEEPKDESEEPIEEVEEAKDTTTEEEKEEAKDEPKEPVEEVEEPVEEVVEEEPSKDTNEKDKSPVEEDKGAK